MTYDRFLEVFKGINYKVKDYWTDKDIKESELKNLKFDINDFILINTKELELIILITI